MRSLKEHAPYSLYKKQTKLGPFWYARYWDETEKQYTIVRSTGIPMEGKRKRWREADDAAKAILEELKQAPNDEAALQKEPEAKPLSSEPVVLAVEPPQPDTSVSNPPSPLSGVATTPFIQYLLDFWTPMSEYAKYKANLKKRPLTAYYIQMNHDDVARHIAPYPPFQSITLGEVTRKTLKKWLIWMSGKKVIHRKKDGTAVEGDILSGRRINAVLQGMRVAVRWAVDNDDLPADPFRKLDEATEDTHEKGILTAIELLALIQKPVTDHFARLSVLLAARCGMRRGEIRGLQWGDIKMDDNLIILQHNFVNQDGLKAPKIKGGTRIKNTTPVPFTQDIKELLTAVRSISSNVGEKDFIIQSRKRKKKGVVVSGEYFRGALIRELKSIGIDESAMKERNITFHSMRHTFVTLGRISGLSDFEIQTIARQTPGVMKRYSHGKQAIDFASVKKRLEEGVNKLVLGLANLPKAAGGNE
jgi:integrase